MACLLGLLVIVGAHLLAQPEPNAIATARVLTAQSDGESVTVTLQVPGQRAPVTTMVPASYGLTAGASVEVAQDSEGTWMAQRAWDEAYAPVGEDEGEERSGRGGFMALLLRHPWTGYLVCAYGLLLVIGAYGVGPLRDKRGASR